MDLRLDFAATKRRLAVLCRTSNMFVNKHSDFLALGYLTGVDVICTLGLLYVTPFGVDSISSSIISLRFWLIIALACMLIYIFDVVHTSMFKRRPGE